ncbi:glycoside hydrolase family 13 protein [Nakamurella endophytica]|uniref:Glycosidase n=1 Tax=Nakamurella endophytica TaxID=1748367 RepID=A0A917SL39_9ACTN|nr:glycoside hydrolase family 13 protein [Nakamurella endophytica]GGL88034.1 glycosidase [Nakamurella endophytica]
MVQPDSTVLTDGRPSSPDATWWRQAVVYQIYPRSFADVDGDGLGDLAGITSRVPYLRDLGVQAVWLSPFYPSALADGGYDVDDYRDVDPRLGSLDDFDAMVAALHDAGIKVVVDIVPNHSSDRHSWFREALVSPPGSPERDRYIFRDGQGPDGSVPPSDWESLFGGPAWERVADGQWYLHMFAREQPDLNWDNADVRADFLRTLRFWSDRGVDGFRVDVAHGLAKDLTPPLAGTLLPDEPLAGGNHPLWDRDEVHDIYREWRSVFDEYDPPRTAVAEAWVHDLRRARYASPEGLGQAFNFDLLEAAWDAGAFRAVIAHNLAHAEQSGASSTWVLSNHDVVRHATRYGLPEVDGLPTKEVARRWLLTDGTEPAVDVDRGLRRARAATLLMLALPGSAYLYQGEELGLAEVPDLPAAAREDPIYFRTGGAERGRDGCRVPLPWQARAEGGESFGFGPGPAHLPQPAWFDRYAVDAELADPASTLRLYRQALALRRQLQGAESLEWLESGNPDVLAFARPGGWQCWTNFGPRPVTVPADLRAGLVLGSGVVDDDQLPPETTVWIA